MTQEKLIYQGKTKDVYLLQNGHCRLQFKDDVTGADGVFDPGANTVGLSIAGMGQQNLATTVHFFELLKKEGIPTHFISADLQGGSMEVLQAKPFGQGVEVICRYRAVGSFIRRYGAYIQEGTPLNAYVEMTLKDDAKGDPLITKDALVQLQIMTETEYDQIAAQTRRITALVARELKKHGLELYDIKLEFGRVNDQVVLMDEISTGNMRAYSGQQSVQAMDLAARILASEGLHG